MSKLLLVIDESVSLFQGVYYTSFEGQNEFFNRYLRIFDSIRIVCRCRHIDKLEDKNKPLDNQKIEVCSVPYFAGGLEFAKNYFSIKKLLPNASDGCDKGILRIPSAMAMIICNQLRRRKIPYAVEVVYDGKDGYMSSSSFMENLIWRYMHHEMQVMSYNAHGVACVTKYYLQQHYYSKRNDYFEANYSTLSLPKSFYGSPRKFPEKNPLIIAHIANQIIFNGRKGHNQVIDAVGILKSKGYAIKVKFAGMDYNNGISLLREYAASKGLTQQVEFLGYLSRKDIDAYLENSDIYVLPTKAEGLPRVLIEAMAKGLPCLTTNVSGNSELIKQEQMFAFDNTEMLAQRIEQLISNPTQYEAISQENFGKSLDYESAVLEKRRDEFYSKLARL